MQHQYKNPIDEGFDEGLMEEITAALDMIKDEDSLNFIKDLLESNNDDTEQKCEEKKTMATLYMFTMGLATSLPPSTVSNSRQSLTIFCHYINSIRTTQNIWWMTQCQWLLPLSSTHSTHGCKRMKKPSNYENPMILSGIYKKHY
jgi:hypothetical protein